MQGFEGAIITNSNVRQLDIRLEDFLNQKGYSMDWINNLLKDQTDNGFARKNVISVSKILTELLEMKFGVKIPYTWGGGHYCNKPYEFLDANGGFNEIENITINPNWGHPFSKEKVKEYTHKDGTVYKNYGPDCTGVLMLLYRYFGVEITNKCTKNIRDGAIYEKDDAMFLPLGKVHLMSKDALASVANLEVFRSFYSIYNENNYMGVPGDLIYRPGHIAMITNVNEKNGDFYVVEARGGKNGLVRSIYTVEEIKVNPNMSIICLDDFYANPTTVLEKKKFTENKEVYSLN